MGAVLFNKITRLAYNQGQWTTLYRKIQGRARNEEGGMANREHVKYLRKGVKAWNQWREENPDAEPDLEGVNLEGMDLEGVDLQKVCLARANLKWANLREAYLVKGDLTKVDLRMANLERADLRMANLEGADLRGAILVWADFKGASLVSTNLSKTNMTGAKLYETARDGWIIESILCKYVFWDREGEKCTPSNMDFRRGEFEELYKFPQRLSTPLSTMVHHVMHLF
jgi:hypothetical protein